MSIIFLYWKNVNLVKCFNKSHVVPGYGKASKISNPTVGVPRKASVVPRHTRATIGTCNPIHPMAMNSNVGCPFWGRIPPTKETFSCRLRFRTGKKYIGSPRGSRLVILGAQLRVPLEPLIVHSAVMLRKFHREPQLCFDYAEKDASLSERCTESSILGLITFLWRAFSCSMVEEIFPSKAFLNWVWYTRLEY